MTFPCWIEKYVHMSTANKLIQPLGKYRLHRPPSSPSSYPSPLLPPPSLCALSPPRNLDSLNPVPKSKILFSSRFSLSLYLKCPGVLASPMNQALLSLESQLSHTSAHHTGFSPCRFLLFLNTNTDHVFLIHHPELLQRHLSAHLACSNTEV